MGQPAFTPNPSPSSRRAIMTKTEFQLLAFGDPRLALHATSAQAVWLWSVDGRHVLWANPVGARVFGAANSAELAKKTFGPADAHRRQVAQLANRLPPDGATRLERLRGFGAQPGVLMTCGCARLDFADGSHGILIHAVGTVARTLPLVERLQHLVEGQELPLAAFARDGLLVGASEAARPLLGFHHLSESGLDQARMRCADPWPRRDRDRGRQDDAAASRQRRRDRPGRRDRAACRHPRGRIG